MRSNLKVGQENRQLVWSKGAGIILGSGLFNYTLHSMFHVPICHVVGKVMTHYKEGGEGGGM